MRIIRLAIGGPIVLIGAVALIIGLEIGGAYCRDKFFSGFFESLMRDKK